MTRWERDIGREVERAGLDLVEVRKGRRHWKVRVRTRHGVRTMVCSASPSDQRALIKTRMVLRRMAA